MAQNNNEEPKLIRDLWDIVDYDKYAWIPIWGEGRCGKTTVAMLSMFKLYQDWDKVLNAIIFNLSQLMYKLRKGEPCLFPTRTKPCHMRVPTLLIDDFAAQCGKAKTQHEKAWDIFKGSFDTLGTRVGILFATMIEPTSATEQLLLKYTHEIKVEVQDGDKHVYKYDKCTREQDYRGWQHRQKKDWIEVQEFGRVPLDVYQQYDEMRMALVDEVFVSIEDSMVEDTTAQILKRMEGIDFQLLTFIKTLGPINHHKLYSEFGEKGKQAVARCKARGLVIPIRKGPAYYTYDITDLALDVLRQSATKEDIESKTSKSSIKNIT